MSVCTLTRARCSAIVTVASQLFAPASYLVSCRVEGEVKLTRGNDRDRGGGKEGHPRYTAGGDGAR